MVMEGCGKAMNSRRAMESRNNDVVIPDVKNPDKKYGWCGMYINGLKFINKPICFLACVCVLVGSQSMIVTGVTSVIITSIQTRFGFTSVQAGAISSSYDTAYGISSIFVSFFGHTRKPYLLGVGSIVLAIGCVVASVPNFMIGSYHAGVVKDIDWCNVNNTLSSIPEDCKGSSAWYYHAIFILAYIIMGFGASPIYILAPSHLDESTMPGQNGMYLGSFYVSATIGTALGFLIGKPMLSIFVDIVQPAGSNLTPDDKIWVGAWWMAYLVGTGLFAFICVPLLGFPQEFQSTKNIRAVKKERGDSIEDSTKLDISLKSLYPASVALLQNKSYMFLTLAITTEGLVIGGFSTFIPKFFESQFFIPASDAALYAGVIFVPGVGGGILLGGYLLKRFKWNCQETLRILILFSALALIASTSIFAGCGSKNITGLNVPYPGETVPNGIDAACRNNCSCTSTYRPICTKANNHVFYSACHAGCPKESQWNKTYYNCSCFPDGITTAEEGSCYSTCDLMYVFMPLFLLTLLFTFLNNVPMVNATFRLVPESQSSYALGFQQVFVRFLGFIPGPIVFGRLVDKTCILWQTDSCGNGENKNCLEYNNSLFRYYLSAIGAAFKLLSLSFLVLTYYFYIPPEQFEANRTSATVVVNCHVAEENGERTVTLA